MEGHFFLLSTDFFYTRPQIPLPFSSRITNQICVKVNPQRKSKR